MKYDYVLSYCINILSYCINSLDMILTILRVNSITLSIGTRFYNRFKDVSNSRSVKHEMTIMLNKTMSVIMESNSSEQSYYVTFVVDLFLGLHLLRKFRAPMTKFLFEYV